MKEVTLRIPGHLDCMKQMRTLGFMVRRAHQNIAWREWKKEGAHGGEKG
jgi:saccharopine dehydrogenase-like NADP-dependent oxidoreductase